jgi:uncharacterized ferredoxin-like protein
MPIFDGKDQEQQGVMEAARLMVISARTAPKSGGVDDICTAIVCGKEIEDLARDMEKISTERDIEAWRQQAKNVWDADAIVLIGVKGTKHYITGCGACGFSGCEKFEKAEKKRGQDFDGPNCIFKAMDLGVAVGSAVKTASNLNVDNRILYRIGVAANRLNYLPEASIILGIPLTVKGKNPYFDRAVQKNKQ